MTMQGGAGGGMGGSGSGAGWGPPGGAPPGGGWAPPQASPPAGAWAPPGVSTGWKGAPPPQGGGPTNWDPIEAWRFGLQRMTADPVGVLGPLVVGLLIPVLFVVPGYATNYREMLTNQQPGFSFSMFGGGLGSFIATCFLMPGMVQFALNVARGVPYAWGDIFGGGKHFLSALVAYTLISAGVGLGFLCLIVPGVLLALCWALTLPVLVDRNLGPIDAMTQAWHLSSGHRGNLLLWGLIGIALSIVGMCACGVGWLIAHAVGYIAWAYVYLRITGQATAEIPSRS